MHRHHPYGASENRRGGFGHGPDRPNRFAPRGGPRGRGGRGRGAGHTSATSVNVGPGYGSGGFEQNNHPPAFPRNSTEQYNQWNGAHLDDYGRQNNSFNAISTQYSDAPADQEHYGSYTGALLKATEAK